nr:hypothetical protein [Oscillochloris trichoides]
MKRTLPEWAIALCMSLGLGVLLTWPLVTRFSTDLPGRAHKDGLEDAYQNVWNLWWTVQAFERPAHLLITDRFFFPETPNLFYHTLAPINTLLVAPVTALWGPIAGFNTVAMLSFALGGLGMWVLARQRVGHGAALLAALVFIASPFHMAALVSDGQLQIFAIQWIPWYVHFLLRSLKDGAAPRLRRPRTAANWLWAGGFLALSAWSDWYYTLFLLIFTLLAVLWHLFQQRQAAGLRGVMLHLVGVGLVAGVGAAPLVLPMLWEASQHTYMNTYPPDDPARLSADLLGFLVPAQLHALWGGAPLGWGVSFAVNRRFYVGVGVAILALLALWKRPAARPWGLMALIFGLLALGAELRVNGVATGIPLPYAFIANLPVVRLTRQPDRFDVLVTLALAMLVAHGATWLTAQIRQPRWRTPLFLLVAGLLLLDYLPAPIITRTPPVPPFFAALPHTDDGALLEYPFHVDGAYRDAERMLFQTIHTRPISGGYHSRPYPQLQLGLPALRDLAAGMLASDIAAEPGGWAAGLRTIGYRYIIGYKQRPLGPRNLQPEQEATFRQLVEAGLGVPGPIYTDDWMIVYEVPQATPAPVVQIRDGWGSVERPAESAAFRWMGTAAELGLIVPQAGTYLLSLEALPAAAPRHMQLDLPTGPVDVTMPAGTRTYTLLLHLPAGRSLIGLRSLDPPTSGHALEGNGDMRPISVRVSNISLQMVLDS